MSGQIRKLLGTGLLRTPLIRKAAWALFFARKVRAGTDVSTLLSSAGHSLDHSLSRGQMPSGATTARTEVLLSYLRKSTLPLSDRDIWAIGLLGIAHYRLAGNYCEGLAAKSRNCASSMMDAGDKESQIAYAIKSRRSIRQWRPDSVRAELLDEVICAATWAPCSCNRQSWRVLILQDHDDKAFLTRFYPSSHNHFWTKAPAVLLILIASSAYNRCDAHYAYLDAGAFVQNLLLAAHARGLGACWVGFMAWDSFGNVRAAPEDQEAFYTRFGCSRDLVPVSVVPLGYPVSTPGAPPRKRLEEVVISKLGGFRHEHEQ